MSLRVGFASRDGNHVDEGLTHGAGCWWIYDIDDTARFVERRVLNGECDGNCTVCGEDPSGELKDCDLLFVTDKLVDTSSAVSCSNMQVIRTRKNVRELTDTIISCVRQRFSPDYFKKVCGFLRFL